MTALSSLIIFEAIVFGLNCIISIVLYLVNRTTIFRYLLILWFAITLQFVAFGTVHLLTTSLVFEAIFENGIMLLFINIIILKILFQLNQSDFHLKPYILFNCGAIIIGIIFAFMGYGFTVVSSIIIFPICLTTIYLTVHLHQHRTEKSALISFFSLLYILGLIHELDYPFMRTVEWFAPYGFTIHAAIYVGFAILLPCILILENQKKYNSELKKREEKYRELVESSSDIVWEVNIDGSFTYISPQVEHHLGYKPDEVLGKTPFSFMHPKVADVIAEQFHSIATKGIPFNNLESPFISKTGQHLIFETSGNPIKDATGNITGYRGIDRDVTEKKLLQEQLNQSSKMDAIGQISGGVAHDFNNILTGIMAAGELLKTDKSVPLNEKQSKYIEMILKASTRAADLTAKLLAFGRKGKISSSSLDIHKIIDESVEILQSTIDKKIKITIFKNARFHTISGDISAIQNAIINLGINASDAMPDGGEITITTKNIELDKSFCKSSQFKISPGIYFELEFRDTGQGIPLDNQKKIFEPFFTTKSQGKGTGLGLASVYGTVQDHHGAISVTSNEGAGTIFHIDLPCSKQNIVNASEETNVESESGTGLILFVDDEKILRLTGKEILVKNGYNVLVAKNGLEAVDIFSKRYQEIDLVIMDMIMPEMNGREAFLKMKDTDENCKVIITSGYTKDEQLTAIGISGFIHKPYSEAKLCRLISEVQGRY